MHNRILAPGYVPYEVAQGGPENYWQMAPAQPDLDVLGTRQSIMLCSVAEDPSRFGFEGTPEATQRLQAAATYILEEQSAQSVTTQPPEGPFVPRDSRATHETATTARFEDLIASHGDLLPEDRERGLDDLGMSLYRAESALTRSYNASTEEQTAAFDRLTALRDLRKQYEDDLYGPVVAMLRRRALTVSPQQAAWEAANGTFGGDPLKNGGEEAAVDFMLTLAGAAQRAFRRERVADMTPEELATAMRLPAKLGGAAVKRLVSFGALRRNAAGDRVTATDVIAGPHGFRHIIRTMGAQALELISKVRA